MLPAYALKEKKDACYSFTGIKDVNMSFQESSVSFEERQGFRRLSLEFPTCYSGSSSLSVLVVAKPDESLIPVRNASSMEGSGNQN